VRHPLVTPPKLEEAEQAATMDAQLKQMRENWQF
jgi:hypothetical protein